MGFQELVFLPLGGAGEIGLNLNLYGLDRKWLMVDLGLSFADDTLPGVDIVANVDDPQAQVQLHCHAERVEAAAEIGHRRGHTDVGCRRMATPVK